MTELLSKYLGISATMQSKLFTTIIIVIIWWIFDRIFRKVIFEKIDDVSIRYQWQKTAKYITVFLLLLFLARIWFGAFDSIGTYFGLLSAGLAIAFQDLLVNLAGWIFILTRKPFSVGDRIEIGDTRGDVIDVRIFQFSIIEIGNWVDADQSTGRIIHIPNGTIFKKPQANFTVGFEYIWNEIPVLITFESDWKKAKKILSDILKSKTLSLNKEAEKQIKEAAKKFMIFYKNLTPIVYTSVKDSGVMLTLRFLCHVRQRRGNEEIIWETILEEFAKHKDIDLAYPTQRFYNNLTEGKQVTK